MPCPEPSPTGLPCSKKIPAGWTAEEGHSGGHFWASAETLAVFDGGHYDASAALAGLRRKQPWARIAPDTLATSSFGPMVTVYDLFAPDRDERVRRAAGLPAEEPAAGRLGGV